MDIPKGYSITSKPSETRWRDEPGWEGFDKWTVTLRNPRGGTLSTQFFMGPGHNGAKPDLESVIDALISDGSAYETTEDLASFASEYGYEIYDDPQEYKRVQKIFNGCKKIAPKIRAFLGEDYERIAYGEQNTTED